ncbi:ABC transporter ATP-binding protein/permease [Actinomyces trachealis]|uniref:ABC transporter ATP-binding protein/permease n=1 Tax=Actinomyces trachealis TaxID=2763540 RepID=UPI001892AA9A|nr:ABC transporter ATP-binding protein/permease [Actinomyces trachealis]
MLELHDVTKSYRTASLTQTALDRVSLSFRDNEFVAVLGQSGSGKTTLLNVIGGLDQFDDGDLVIDGVSTQDYRDRDWDTYRNNRIGFVFQSYNLIPHQSVLANVELALTLSGVSRSQRRARARQALEDVGLAEHSHKRPSQLSGGQMQRVAIARALINDPKILLADEPTGALDSATSIQVMDLLREVARERLVIMVTHNPELARSYANRVVTLADGQVQADTNPFDPAAPANSQADGQTEGQAEGQAAEQDLEQETGLLSLLPGRSRTTAPARATRMGLLTALALSFNNLMTKKGRTLMTSFAGSIGIIGIAAILALANGVNAYIAKTEEEALTSYPLSIQRSTMDLGSVIEAADDDRAQGSSQVQAGHLRTRNAFTAMMGSRSTNDLASLKTFLEIDGARVRQHVRSIEYHYNVTPQIYRKDTSQGVVQVHPEQAVAKVRSAAAASPLASFFSLDAFKEMPAEPSLYQESYEVMAGTWPTQPTELVLVLNPDGTMQDLYEYTLGLRDHTELDKMMAAYLDRQNVTSAAAHVGPGSSEGVEATPGPGSQGLQDSREYRYEDILGTTFSLVPASARYQYDQDYGVWTDLSQDQEHMRQAISQGRDLQVVGIVKPKGKEDGILRGLCYLPSLTAQVIEQAASSQIVKDQLAYPERDVFTGKTFTELADQAKQGPQGLDLSSLFTVDGEQIKAAFKVDPTVLQTDLDSLDLSGVNASSIDVGSLDLSGLDLSSLDLSEAAQLDLSGLDLSTLNLTDLATRYPQLAQVDYVSIITKALADGAIKDTAGAQVSATAAQVLSGFTKYASEHPGPDTDGDGVPETNMVQLVADYLATPEVSKAINDVATSDQVLDRAKLTSNLTTALGQDPAIAAVAKDVGDKAAAVIGQEISKQLANNLSKAISTTLSSYLQQTFSSAMTQMMTALQTQISTQVEKAMTSLASNLSRAMSVDEEAFKKAFNLSMNQEQLSALLSTLMRTTTTSRDSNLAGLGWADTADPSAIDIYPKDFKAKDAIKTVLAEYNQARTQAGEESKTIRYTDVVALLMSSVTRIINIITWMLVAFVSISLVVSSIMIAIITYISVLERKKEIGILRAIGASKADVRHVFNAETLIEGLLAGLLGIGITLLLSLPANAFVSARFGVYPIAHLPTGAALVLIGVSVGLTLFAGLLPASKAAREDPVEALRSE